MSALAERTDDRLRLTAPAREGSRTLSAQERLEALCDPDSLHVICHGAKLLHAFAEAVVPKVTVVLRKAFGGGYITMNSRDLGADLVLAWPGAEIGIMGPKQAVGIVHRREIAAADDPAIERDRLAIACANDHLTAEAAAREGHVDELVGPGETRERLAGALAARSIPGRYGNGPGNIPL